MKKIFLGGVLVLVVTVIVVIFNFNQNINLLTIDKENIEKISITSGINGKVVEVNKENYDAICDNIVDLKGKKQNNFNSTGWVYKISFYKKDSLEEITFISEKMVIVSNQKYRINEESGEKIITVLKENVNK